MSFPSLKQFLIYLMKKPRNFALHVLWPSTTGKYMAISQTCQFQLFLTDLPSNFWKIAWLLGPIKNTIWLRFLSLPFFENYPSFALTCSLLLISSSPHCWELCLCCKVLEIIKVGTSTLLVELSFRQGFYLVNLTANLTSVVQEWSVSKEYSLLLPEVMNFYIDMLQITAWIIYTNACFGSFVMYIWT